MVKKPHKLKKTCKIIEDLIVLYINIVIHKNIPEINEYTTCVKFLWSKANAVVETNDAMINFLVLYIGNKNVFVSNSSIIGDNTTKIKKI